MNVVAEIQPRSGHLLSYAANCSRWKYRYNLFRVVKRGLMPENHFEKCSPTLDRTERRVHCYAHSGCSFLNISHWQRTPRRQYGRTRIFIFPAA